jgi:sigma-B regulation protein RsbU (phosphoserine phosphatase)
VILAVRLLLSQVQAAGNPTELLVAVLALILVLALALLAAILLRRWQSRRTLVRRLADLTKLAEVGQALAGAQLDSGRLAELVFQQAGQIVPTNTFQLGLFEGDRYRLLIWAVDGQRRSPAEFELKADNLGIIGWLRESRQRLLVRDFEREAASLPAQPRYVAADPPRSAVFVPLLSRGCALGVIAIQSRAPNAFDEEDLRRLAIVANQAASAFENAQLFEQAQRRATQLELLAGVSQRINVLQPLPALYRQIVDLVAAKFTEYTVSYYECEEQVLTLCVSSAGAVPGGEPDARVHFGEGPAGQAAERRTAVTVPASRDHLPLAPAGQPALAPGGRPSQMAVPVEIDERVLGVLLISSHSGAAFDDSAQAVIQSLAAQMAIAILEAQFYAAEQRRGDQLAALAQASRTVASTLDLDDMLDEVLDVFDEHFGYKSVRIFLLHDDRLVYQAGIGQGTVGQSIEGLTYPLNGPGLIALAGRSRHPVQVDEVSERPEYVAGPGLGSTKSEMAAPMNMGSRLLGVLDVQSDRAAAFTSEDARTLQTLADTLAVAVRNARLFEYERRRRRLAEIMREVSAALTSTLQLDRVLDLILDGLALVLSYDAASILLLNDVGEMILRASRGAPAAADAIGTAIALKRFGPGESVSSILPFGEVDLERQYHDLLSLPEPHACLAAPLAPGGEHLGYLVVDRGDQARFPQGEVELIATFASQAAVAIENARLYTAQREQAWISTALLQVADATAHATELDDVLDTVARLTPLLVGVDRCAILMADGEHWRLAAQATADEADTAADLAPGLAAEPALETWPRLAELREQRTVLVLDPEEARPAALREWFTGVAILLPLLARGEVAGALVVGQVPGHSPFTVHRIQLLTGIANQAALAVESAMLSASQQEEAWVSTALLQVAESVAGQPLEIGLETVARLTPILVGIERIAIYQYEPTAHAFRLRQLTGLDRPAAAALQGRSITLAELGLARDDPLLATAPPWHLSLPLDLASLFGGVDCSVWPLRARGDILGALVTEAVPDLGRRLTILGGIAHQLAMAMENARLTREVAQQERLERELEVGRDIQASLLPQKFPQAEGWEVAASWRAARQVGGDFYDFFELQPAEAGPRWGVVIADVADKGVPAALFMALSRTLLRSVAIGRVAPADTLRRVNELILSDARSEQFVTVFYGVLEPSTGRFCYAIAGHNPPVWARAGGTAAILPGRGIALGVIDQVEYQEHEARLDPGDSLVLYTDGLTEAINTQLEEFGLPRVLEVVRANYRQTAPRLLQALSEAVEAHVNGAEVFDDMTLVVLKRSGA